MAVHSHVCRQVLHRTTALHRAGPILNPLPVDAFCHSATSSFFFSSLLLFSLLENALHVCCISGKICVCYHSYLAATQYVGSEPRDRAGFNRTRGAFCDEEKCVCLLKFQTQKKF